MKQIPLDIGLKPCPRLETWVAGPNQQLYAHVQDVLARQGAVATTTYVWGPTGSGRTHLLQAVVQGLQDQGLHVGWLDAQCRFAPAFDQRWSAVVLDDVYRYNAQQQHMAFNWFVHARANDSGQPVWVLAAGDVPVTDLPLRDDLRSRLGWGLTFALQPLGEAEVRLALRQTAQERGLELTDEVLNYMLTRFARDLGSLNGLLDRLDDYALETRRALSIPLLKQMLNETDSTP